MSEINKTLYLWDLAGTLFHEEWDGERTSFSSYKNWLEDKLDKSFASISPREYEENYYIPLTEGWHLKLALKPGFREILEWSKYNEIFTGGTKEQLGWRAEYLNPRVSFDIKQYFSKIHTPFNYGETNVKTSAMMADILKQAYRRGFRTVVYTDDKLSYIKSFQKATKVVQDKFNDFTLRAYHILNDKSGLHDREGYFTIGCLGDLPISEKNIRSSDNE